MVSVWDDFSYQWEQNTYGYPTGIGLGLRTSSGRGQVRTLSGRKTVKTKSGPGKEEPLVSPPRADMLIAGRRLTPGRWYARRCVQAMPAQFHLSELLEMSLVVMQSFTPHQKAARISIESQ